MYLPGKLQVTVPVIGTATIALSSSSLSCSYECAILEELDNLCHLIGLQVQPCATTSDKNTSRTQQNQSGRLRRVQLSVATTWKISRFLLGSLVFPLHLLLLSSAAKQVKLIQNHLCCLNGQIDTPEVWLTWCYAVTIRCPLNFLSDVFSVLSVIRLSREPSNLLHTSTSTWPIEVCASFNGPSLLKV